MRLDPYLKHKSSWSLILIVPLGQSTKKEKKKPRGLACLIRRLRPEIGPNQETLVYDAF